MPDDKAPTGLEMFNLLQLKYALKLEMVGLKHSQGSVYALIKRRYGFKGNKHKVYDQLLVLIGEKDKAFQRAKEDRNVVE